MASLGPAGLSIIAFIGAITTVTTIYSLQLLAGKLTNGRNSGPGGHDC